MSSVGVGSFAQFLASFDPDPHVRGKQFEKAVKWLLLNDPKHKRKYKNVWLWDEFPDRTGPDIGIDVVAQGHDNSLCAIQAKCFDSGRDIPKSEIDSFISAASPRKYAHRMLVATTDGLSANARKTLRDNHVTLVLKSSLESLESFWPETFSSLGAPRTISKYVPRTHQAQAINDVSAGLQTASRGQLIMACGTGKTLTALWITERLDSSCTLVLVPSLSLLSQTLSEWTTHANTQWSYLCVCSDETVNKNDDMPISNVDDLPFEVTTKPADIAKFLKTRGRKIVFSTYQSSAQVAKAQRLAGKKFDLTIADEAHRLTGKNDAEFATVLDQKKIPTKKLLFMTATPRTYTPAIKQTALDRGVEISSMDDEKVFGKELHKLSFGQAIEQDLLTDYRVVIVGVTDPQVQELIEKRELVSVGGKVETDARTLAAHIGLAKAVKDYDLKKTISFHGRIKTAQSFAHDFPNIVEWMPDDHKPSGTFWADTITGAMNSSDRRILLEKLKADFPNQHSLLSNARCLTEGIDVPALDAVAFIDPRSSQVDIIQAVGRAIRKSNKKTLGTIVLPVLIPHDADAENALEDTAFKSVWTILNALKSHDNQLSEELNRLRTELGKTSKVGSLPSKIIQDLPADIDILLPDFSNKLSLAILERSTSSWDWWFGLMESYIKVSGTSYIPSDFVYKSHRLGQWVTIQRSNYKNNSLSTEKKEKLNHLPGWTWDVLDTQWQTAYDALVKFEKLNGHLNVRRKDQQDGVKLRIWIGVQRRNFKKEKLRPEYVALLEKLNGWSWDPFTDQWFDQLESLRKFAESEGHCTIPRRDPKYKGLAIWASHQRNQYTKKLLSNTQVTELEKVNGWDWSPGSDGFEELELYFKKFNNVNVPLHYVSGDFKLGRWCARKRSQYKKRTIPETDIERLQKFESWKWDPDEDEWNIRFDLLSQYARTNGKPLPPRGYIIDGVDLYKFAKHLRTRFNAQSKARQNKIKTLPGWSLDVFDQLFQENLDALNDYLQHKPLASINTKTMHEFHGSLFNLGQWLNGRRSAYKKGLLPETQRLELEAIPNWTWNPIDVIYETNFKALRIFAQREQHSNVPKGHIELVNGVQVPLGSWVSGRRKLYKIKKLTKLEIDELNSFPGWTWNPIADKFERGFSALEEFVKLNGTSAATKETVVVLEDGTNFRLGSWVSVQRRNYSTGNLEPSRQKRLESLVGWSWDPKDHEWQIFFNALVTYVKKNGYLPTRGYINQDGLKLGAWCDWTRGYYKNGQLRDDRISLLESIPDWSWNPHEESWERKLRLLQKFLKENPNTEIPPKLVIDGENIGNWAAKQRAIFKDGKLSKTRTAALNKVKGWTWEKSKNFSTGKRSDPENIRQESQWLKLLDSYIKSHGDSDVSREFVIDGERLGLWVCKVRSRHRGHTLPKSLIQQLSARPEWFWDVNDFRWENNFNQLMKQAQKGKLRKGKLMVDEVLSSWAKTQRVKFKGGKLPKAQVKKLESIPNWTWDPLSDSWESKFAALQSFVKREGHARVPQNHYEGDIALGTWVNKRRSAWKKNNLDKNEVIALSSLPGWTWDPTKSRKTEAFQLLQRFIEREGHPLVPAKHVEEGFALGLWVTNRRQAFRKGKLTSSEKTKLESVQGWKWTTRK